MILILLLIFYSGCLDSNTNKKPESIIQFTADDVNDTLTVAHTNPNLLWSSIVVEGTYTYKPNGTIYVGEEITGCKGTITLIWVNNNTLLDSFQFNEYKPTIEMQMDDLNNTITVISTDAIVVWSDLEITGSCNISNLGTYITNGDVITRCYGEITIRYKPTNALLKSFSFTQSTPNIVFDANDTNDTLRIVNADGNILWSDIEITGSCNTSSLGVYVIADDKITHCSGEIGLRYIPTNTYFGFYVFT